MTIANPQVQAETCDVREKGHATDLPLAPFLQAVVVCPRKVIFSQRDVVEECDGRVRDHGDIFHSDS